MFISAKHYQMMVDQIAELKATLVAKDKYIAQLTDRLLAKEAVPLTQDQIHDAMLKDIKMAEDNLGIFNDLDGGDTDDVAAVAFGERPDKNEVGEFTQE